MRLKEPLVRLCLARLAKKLWLRAKLRKVKKLALGLRRAKFHLMRKPHLMKNRH
jgi:hypothetical protein